MKHQYTLNQKGIESQQFCYDTIREARAILAPAHNPRIVRLANGKFDAFPKGQPLPAGAEIVEYLKPTPNGKGKWVAVENEEM